MQWVSNAFLHADIFHLLGNMAFLWTFGIIVEGKLGWYRMLGIYLLMAAAEGAIVQIMMLGSVGASLGASGAIFGLMAMSLIWAPENRVDCLVLIVVRVVTYEVKVMVLVGLFLFFQFAGAVWTKMAMSSDILHLIGAIGRFFRWAFCC